MERWIDLAFLLLSMAREFLPLVVEAVKGRRPTIEREDKDVRIYRLPNFNLIGRAWVAGRLPADGGADEEDLPCQIYCDPRHNTQSVGTSSREYLPGLWIRYPIEYLSIGELNVWEVPQDQGRFYKVIHVHIQHEGFPNEYLAALVVQCDENGNQVYFPGGESGEPGDPVAGGEGEIPDTEFIPSGAAGEGAGSYTYEFLLEEWTV